MSTTAHNLNLLLWAVRNFERYRTWALEDLQRGDLTGARDNAAKSRAAWAEIQKRRPIVESSRVLLTA